MSDEKALAPIEEKEVEFYGDDITAVRTADGNIYVPIRPICRLLGLNWDGQRRRILRDSVLDGEARGVVVTTTQGSSQEMTCLPLDYISGFLFGINANRVKPELRERVILYQRECYKTLAEAFQEGRLTADPTFSELLEGKSPAAQAYKMARAMMELARNQLLLEARLDSHDTRFDQHENRLEEIEATLGDSGRNITPDQASQLSQAVKAVAMVLSKRSGRNEYGGVYGEFYRKFGITSYKLLPATRFEGAMEFLAEWYRALKGTEPF